MAQNTYDLVIIGSGPSGQKAALNAAKLGKRVALIDRKELVGGVCIHTGTIPSKAIREAVLHLTAFNERSVYGNSYAVKHDITMDDLLYRSGHVVRTEVDVVRNQMHRNGVEMLFGDASFVDPHSIRVATIRDEVEIHAEHILVAVGTEPARPKMVPFLPGKIIDSNELLQLKELPKSLIIVGGGDGFPQRLDFGLHSIRQLVVRGTRARMLERLVHSQAFNQLSMLRCPHACMHRQEPLGRIRRLARRATQCRDRRPCKKSQPLRNPRAPNFG